MEDFQSHNWLEMGSRWFNLPSYDELVKYIYELFMTQVKPSNMYKFENSKGELYFPVVFEKEAHQAVFFDVPVSDELENALKEWKSYVEEHPNQQY